MNKILKTHGPANVITANYVFANIDNLNQFIIDAKKLLSKNGVLVIKLDIIQINLRKKCLIISITNIFRIFQFIH